MNRTELLTLLEFAQGAQWTRSGRWLRSGVALVGYMETEADARGVEQVMRALPALVREVQRLQLEVESLRERERALIKADPELGPRDPFGRHIG